MSYNYYLSATAYIKNRWVMVGVGTPEMEQASDLSDMGLSEITNTLAELNAVIEGQLDYLDWGTDLFYVSSEATVSNYGRYDKAERPQVPTIGLRNFLIELKKFKEQCLTKDYYKVIIGQAFTAIKANPLQYKRWTTSDLYYLITLNNITITLVLEPDDFDLSVGQYITQLARSF
ncbi:hypothetical protein SAMN05443633_104280 [Chryseobacterium arachidis]|uniref:Uncharacterized protein n=2 Tax=Chryseobacterium arachidis TaxID=1416778 RepID=A0A1M5BSQ2_9FLAO|nr:hypothetical protein [Chryseobacterium arachidis]SHF45485.1 hypothetical protein SAMN05443633_104280 [Chryseobacterium arachidis]